MPVEEDVREFCLSFLSQNANVSNLRRAGKNRKCDVEIFASIDRPMIHLLCHERRNFCRSRENSVRQSCVHKDHMSYFREH